MLTWLGRDRRMRFMDETEPNGLVRSEGRQGMFGYRYARAPRRSVSRAKVVCSLTMGTSGPFPRRPLCARKPSDRLLGSLSNTMIYVMWKDSDSTTRYS